MMPRLNHKKARTGVSQDTRIRAPISVTNACPFSVPALQSSESQGRLDIYLLNRILRRRLVGWQLDGASSVSSCELICCRQRSWSIVSARSCLLTDAGGRSAMKQSQTVQRASVTEYLANMALLLQRRLGNGRCLHLHQTHRIMSATPITASMSAPQIHCWRSASCTDGQPIRARHFRQPGSSGAIKYR